MWPRRAPAVQLKTPEQVAVMREAGLVVARVDEQRRLYRLRPGPLRELDAWLAPYRQAWATSLDKLEAHLDRWTTADGGVPDEPTG